MKNFFGKVWTGIKKIMPKGDKWLDVFGFVLLVLFYAVIPFILFCEQYGGQGSKISLALCVGVIIIIIVFKRMWLNDQAASLRTRIGTMTDTMRVETDQVKKNRLAYRIAWKNTILVMLNMIVPILCIVTVVLFTAFMESTALALAQLKTTIYYASISFAMGILVQITFPFIKAKMLQDKG